MGEGSSIMNYYAEDSKRQELKSFAALKTSPVQPFLRSKFFITPRDRGQQMMTGKVLLGSGGRETLHASMQQHESFSFVFLFSLVAWSRSDDFSRACVCERTVTRRANTR